MREIASDEECAQRIIQVLPKIMRFLANEARRQGRERQLTVSQFRVLLRLSEREYAVSELARCHDVSLPTMSVVVDGLVRRGLVERTQRGDDRRSVILRVTAEGRAILGTFHRAAVESLRPLMAMLEAEKLSALADALDALDAALARGVPKGTGAHEAASAPGEATPGLAGGSDA